MAFSAIFCHDLTILAALHLHSSGLDILKNVVCDMVTSALHDKASKTVSSSFMLFFLVVAICQFFLVFLAGSYKVPGGTCLPAQRGSRKLGSDFIFRGYVFVIFCGISIISSFFSMKSLFFSTLY